MEDFEDALFGQGWSPGRRLHAGTVGGVLGENSDVMSLLCWCRAVQVQGSLKVGLVDEVALVRAVFGVVTASCAC